MSRFSKEKVFREDTCSGGEGWLQARIPLPFKSCLPCFQLWKSPQGSSGSASPLHWGLSCVSRPWAECPLAFSVPAENPCQDQGDIIQIKLSEHTEVVPKADGTGSTTMLVDTVFEMNYATGQWTRLKKYKPITNVS